MSGTMPTCSKCGKRPAAGLYPQWCKECREAYHSAFLAITSDQQPRVACVMLTCNRPKMARRAVECFRRQTYDPIRRALLIFDTSDSVNECWYDARSDSENEIYYRAPGAQRSIGVLRNIANALIPHAQIIAHWDDDDWSHPARLEEQVAFLKASGAGVVAYNDMLFWRALSCNCPSNEQMPRDGCRADIPGEAWLYRSPNPKQMVGTSLFYWRDVWERVPFGPEHCGEDAVWVLKLASARVTTAACSSIPQAEPGYTKTPRMIASIHGANTSSRITPGVPEWARAACWDGFAKETMAL